jgi:hypothetical protein
MGAKSGLDRRFLTDWRFLGAEVEKVEIARPNEIGQIRSAK